uniref:Uncharacterized protein n=1 Tax=Pseudonaja textilis TaxID=8673 RepID=A0A670Y096_PSETE
LAKSSPRSLVYVVSQNLEISIEWDLDVQPLISSAKWLQLYGLKKNKMTFSQIFSQIGFQHKEDYVSILGKIVASRYADGLYHQYRAVSDGKIYNVNQNCASRGFSCDSLWN